MSRDSNGNYTLPAGNPVVTATTITSTWANTTLDDIADAITDSLDRNGEGAMLAPLLVPDGTFSAPTLAFSSETNTGFYWYGAGEIGITTAGVLSARLSEGQVDIYGTTPKLRFTEYDASVDNKNWNIVAAAETLYHNVLLDDTTATPYITVSRTADTVDEIRLDATALDFNADLDLSGAAVLHSTLDVTGATTLSSTLHTVGAATLDSTLGVTGATTLSSTLHTVGAATFDAAVTVTGVLTADGIPVSKTKTSATARNNTTTLADDPDLSAWSLAAGKLYSYRAVLYVTDNNGGGGIRFRFQWSNAAQDNLMQIVGSGLSGFYTTASASLPIAGDAGVSALGGGAGGTETCLITSNDLNGTNCYSYIITINGVFLANASTGGTFNFQWAQETSDNDTSRVEAMSTISVTRLN